MTREEILEKSQNENKGKDVADIETSKTGFMIGWIMMSVLSLIVMVVDGIVFGRVSFELPFILVGSLAALFFYKFIKLHKRHELIVASVYSFAAICWLVAWIIQLANH